MARQFLCEKDAPVVQTKYGKLRGFQLDGTYTFYGIKYANAKRWQMPTEPDSWEEIKDALAYGYVSPMLNQDNPTNELMVPHRYWPLDENCQYLNVWTQSLDPAAKKPVLVWFHGGGFAAGSSIEQVCYEGDNMSKYGDCVVVTINHRLNILGYLDMSPYGPQFKNSGNAGNGDMLYCLKWVHDNIAAFGGDPENVTIFGQSGGGAKVTCMLQTPAADGLFHRAVIISGVGDFPKFPTNMDSTRIVEALMDELKVDIEGLQTVPYYLLAEAYKKVSPKVRAEGYYVGGDPIADDFYLGDPLEVGFTEHAITVPTMVGTVIAEFGFGPGMDKNASEEEKTAAIKAHFGEGYAELIARFREAYPEKDLTVLPIADTMARRASREYVLKKAAAGGAPTYSYMFTYDFPYEGGKPAWHCSDLPFFFHNTERVAIANEPGVSDRLEAQMFGALMAFARTGNPSIPALPEWAPCTGDYDVVMKFDRVCSAAKNFDADFLPLLYELAPKFDLFGGGVKVEH